MRKIFNDSNNSEKLKSWKRKNKTKKFWKIYWDKFRQSSARAKFYHRKKIKISVENKKLKGSCEWFGLCAFQRRKFLQYFASWVFFLHSRLSQRKTIFVHFHCSTQHETRSDSSLKLSETAKKFHFASGCSAQPLMAAQNSFYFSWMQVNESLRLEKIDRKLTFKQVWEAKKLLSKLDCINSWGNNGGRRVETWGLH